MYIVTIFFILMIEIRLLRTKPGVGSGKRETEMATIDV